MVGPWPCPCGAKILQLTRRLEAALKSTCCGSGPWRRSEKTGVKGPGEVMGYWEISGLYLWEIIEIFMGEFMDIYGILGYLWDIDIYLWEMIGLF